MYITNRDKEILKYLERNKSITINQCQKIFFSKNKDGYQQARKRLRKLYKDKYIKKRFRKDCRSEVIYYQNKKLSEHDLKVFDVVAELVFNNFIIIEFTREYTIKTLEKDYRADAFIIAQKKNLAYLILLEIDHTHYTSYKKLKDIYDSKHFQKRFGADIFPFIVILKRLNLVENRMYSDDFKLIQLSYAEIYNIPKKIQST